jgi:hypothetical protein
VVNDLERRAWEARQIERWLRFLGTQRHRRSTGRDQARR